MLRLILLLAGHVHASETRNIYIAKHWRPRRQQRRSQEIGVKVISPGRRRVDIGAAFVDAGGLAIEEQADNGSAIIQSLASPVFQITKKIMDSAVSSKVLRR